MNEPGQTTGATPGSTTANGSNFAATLLRAAWLSILLGVGMQVLLVLIAAGSGFIPELGPIAAALVQKISWSVIICMGLAVGTAASAVRAQLMGLLGLLAAPLAFNAARSLQQATTQLLGIAEATSAGPSVFLLALIKGVEYACLGVAIGWIGRRPWGGVVAHAAAGIAVGMLFGGLTLTLTYSSAPEPLSTPELISRGIDEIIFPVGCALVIFSAEALGKRVAQ